MLRLIIALALLVVLIAAARAEDHEHGVNGLPDWYDPHCCSQRDCKPVEDSDIDFGENQWGLYARYIPTGNIFYKGQFKLSQDERYHVCINPDNGSSLCFYDRAGV